MGPLKCYRRIITPTVVYSEMSLFTILHVANSMHVVYNVCNKVLRVERILQIKVDYSLPPANKYLLPFAFIYIFEV